MRSSVNPRTGKKVYKKVEVPLEELTEDELYRHNNRKNQGIPLFPLSWILGGLAGFALLITLLIFGISAVFTDFAFAITLGIVCVVVVILRLATMRK